MFIPRSATLAMLSCTVIGTATLIGGGTAAADTIPLTPMAPAATQPAATEPIAVPSTQCWQTGNLPLCFASLSASMSASLSSSLSGRGY